MKWGRLDLIGLREANLCSLSCQLELDCGPQPGSHCLCVNEEGEERFSLRVWLFFLFFLLALVLILK